MKVIERRLAFAWTEKRNETSIDAFEFGEIAVVPERICKAKTMMKHCCSGGFGNLRKAVGDPFGEEHAVRDVAACRCELPFGFRPVDKQRYAPMQSDGARVQPDSQHEIGYLPAPQLFVESTDLVEEAALDADTASLAR